MKRCRSAKTVFLGTLAAVAVAATGLASLAQAGGSGAGGQMSQGEYPPAEMVLIPAGSFQMGDACNEGDPDEQPVHTVYVSAFYMDRYEVAKGLWDEVAAWAVSHGYDIGPGTAKGKGPYYPATHVSWYEAVKWANARSEKEGLTPCYTESGAVYRAGQSYCEPTCNWSTDGYRLPTEAEWEKAARGGHEGRRFAWSETDTITHSLANYWSTTDCSYDRNSTRGFHPMYEPEGFPYTSPVGSFVPNGYGLYDMVGNVWEWCWDWWDWYGDDPGWLSDPRGASSGSYRLIRVTRGGSWISTADYCRVASRYASSPPYSSGALGFRLVRVAP